MIKRSNLILVALFCTGIYGHRAYSQVTADYDRAVDFTKYTTYGFAGWQNDSDQQLNDLDKERIHDAFISEFSERGITKSENPEMRICLFIVIDQKTSTTAYTTYMGGMGYGPYWGWGMGAGVGSSTTTYSQNDYKEGTLVIDCYDEVTKKLIWQGVMTATVKNPKKREKSIPKNIAKLMSKYPVKPQ